MTDTDKQRNIKDDFSITDLVLDMLSSHPSHELPVATLCKGAALFQIPEQSVRVALTRLTKTGKVRSSARGVYALNPEGNSLLKDVGNWISKEHKSSPWQGGWIGVHDSGVARSKRVQWRAHERALSLRGFERIFDGLSIRPNNLLGGLPVLQQDLRELGLAKEARVFVIQELSPEDCQAARNLWDREQLRAGYRSNIEEVERRILRLDLLPEEEAAAESLLFGRRMIQQIIKDPLLPEELVPSRDRLKLISLVQEYQTKAIKIWFKVLAE